FIRRRRRGNDNAPAVATLFPFPRGTFFDSRYIIPAMPLDGNMSVPTGHTTKRVIRSLRTTGRYRTNPISLIKMYFLFARTTPLPKILLRHASRGNQILSLSKNEIKVPGTYLVRTWYLGSRSDRMKG